MEKTKLEKLAHLSGKVTSNLSMHSGNTGSISVGSCPRRSTECLVGLLRLSRTRASGRSRNHLQLASARRPDNPVRSADRTATGNIHALGVRHINLRPHSDEKALSDDRQVSDGSA